MERDKPSDDPQIIKLSELLVDFYNLFHSWEEDAIKDLRTNLSILEVHTIEALGRRPGLKMREVAEVMEISTPSVTSVVDKLEKKGFARRKTTPTDRRVFLIELTQKGMEVFERHSQQHKKIAEAVLSCIPDETAPVFLKLLTAILGKTGA